MRVGILTFHLGPNHGGYLQAWCLSQFLRDEGHEVEIINYKNPTLNDDEKFRPWIYRRPLKLYHAWIKERVFAKAYQELPLSDFTTDRDKVEWQRYDAVVVGSDVVWDFCWPRLGKDPIYFGHFGSTFSGRRIAYAPSVGTMTKDAEVPKWVHTGLPLFDSLSVRDQATSNLVKNVSGTAPLQVVDPTWLDCSFEKNEATKKEHLVIYAYDIAPELRTQIVAYAKKNGLKIIAVGYYHSWADKNDLTLSPLEWPKLVGEAKAMIAGTFHGTLYAIKMQCQFVTPYHPQIQNRVSTALKISGLESRLVKNPKDLDKTFSNPIDYKKTVELLKPHIEESRNFLRESLCQK
ncbi:polysaccharide pyruvyl transferase family protein [Akkermansiaceae bacterium]|nr:polysaccharide pyruvyl transferase family protein [Akkermansiaceae bacterium]